MPARFNYPFYIFLFPLFFVFHAFTQQYYLVDTRSALLFSGIYILTALLFTIIFYAITKNRDAAALTAFFVLSYQFFFGYLLNALRSSGLPALFSRYSFLLILFIGITILLLIVLRKKKNLSKFNVYLNLLFILLIAIDLFQLIQKIIRQEDQQSTKIIDSGNSCDSCARPDIYFILLDGYAGQEQLKKGFDFDNSSFLQELDRQGFHTSSHSKSNYLFTPYSVASILDMNYLDSTKINKTREAGSRYSLELINRNSFTTYLVAKGYSIYNYSIFRVNGKAPPVGSSMLTANARLINQQTFTHRFQEEVLYNLALKLGWKKYVSNYMFRVHKDNERIFDLTTQVITKKDKDPKFVFAHLMMPHDPYYHDESGQLRSFKALDSIGIRNKPAYLANLHFTNKKILELVDLIISKSPGPPVILLMSDHGYRYDYENPISYLYFNLQSVYFPDRDYTNIRDSLTAVNFFPAISNKLFMENFPMRADSSFTFGF